MQAALLSLLSLTFVFGRGEDTRLVKPKMSFREASKPYEDAAYDVKGYVDSSGKVQGGLGCSAYTSVVLHRLRDGDEWLERYDLKVHQWYGDRAAKHFGLVKAATFSSEEIYDRKKVQKEIDSGRLGAGVLYYFNVRRGVHGHVGFVRLNADGRFEQAHYSMLVNGLYRGDFRDWLKKSMYRSDARVELYRVPEPRQANHPRRVSPNPDPSPQRGEGSPFSPLSLEREESRSIPSPGGPRSNTAGG